MGSNNATYLVCGTTPWARRVFGEVISAYPGRWEYISDPAYLRPAALGELKPRYIFFLHWSLKVPMETLAKYECVGFHMTPLPYGRGGSPLQNLIMRGHRETTLTAFQMTAQMDAGPIYDEYTLSLEGLAEEIYVRAMDIAAEMIKAIAEHKLRPHPQRGDVIIFQRRTPAESQIPKCDNLLALFDFLRMLDADGYPRAFLRHKGYRYEFSRPALRDGRIMADVTITREEQQETLLGYPIEYVDNLYIDNLPEIDLQLGDGL